MKDTGITVIMPTFNQASFLPRALYSLKVQTFKQWQLIIINDGSTDCTNVLIQDYLVDKRIVYIQNIKNEGLGTCLNQGIEQATFDLIAYLPSDDIYFNNHLESLFNTLTKSDALLAYAGMQIQLHNAVSFDVYMYEDVKQIEYPLQLIQVLHNKTDDRWTERSELVTDDYHLMFWHKLSNNRPFLPTHIISCEFTDHPDQRHKIINEQLGGGIFLYKQFYGVNQPIKFQSAGGNLIDEKARYTRFKKDITFENNPLKILLVGELAFNPERILAFEEKGHKLYGLWIDSPGFFNTTGPLPFGHIIEIENSNWREQIHEIKPDLIYALLNFPAVPLAHQVLSYNKDIPFIWHLKESPFDCRQKGVWPQMMDLYTLADGVIHCNNEVKNWIDQFIPEIKNKSFVLDGDLPKYEWFAGEREVLLSSQDGEFHTVLAGRPIGINIHDIIALSKQKIHLHFYGDVHQKGQGGYWLKQAVQNAPDYFHVHSNCDQENWLSEFSKYDAGWLHFFESRNNREIIRSSWNDLNIPARLATYVVAGLPIIQPDNTGHLVATQSLTQDLDIGIFINKVADLICFFEDEKRMNVLRENVWKHRMKFCFDSHMDDLIEFFRLTISRKLTSD